MLTISLPNRAPQMNPAVTQLSLYDVANTKGVAADVSHINSRAKVQVRGLAARRGQCWCRQLPLPPQLTPGGSPAGL
jgi:hypothetical protein